ncbi:hypothetical protein GCM10025789_08300 [Tessaracoccus lubricantis]|uniref:SseB protein N-terminal domain-containing protein n=1 Tax=Tessaracoccus lubricantis TaxID=545543 RepID=A0ABP9F4R9_9ACTN
MTRRITGSQHAVALAKSAAWAGITLIDPHRLTGWRKHAYWLAMAGGVAAETALTDDPYSSPALRAGIGVGAAGVTYGAQDLLARSDAWSIGLLRRLGLKRPRVWAAAAVFASSLAVSLAEAAKGREFPFDDGFDDEGQPLPETLEPLPDEARAVITALLGAVDGWGGDELRSQLEGAACRPEQGQFLLVPDEEAPRTLLDSYTFPAVATFRRDGLNHVLMLDVEDGLMAYLTHFVEPYPDDDSGLDLSLPAAGELKIVLGQADASDA